MGVLPAPRHISAYRSFHGLRHTQVLSLHCENIPKIDNLLKIDILNTTILCCLFIEALVGTSSGGEC